MQSSSWLLLLLFIFGEGMEGRRKEERNIFWVGGGGLVGFETILSFGRGDGVMKERLGCCNWSNFGFGSIKFSLCGVHVQVGLTRVFYFFEG